MKRKHREPQHTTDADGAAVVLMPLANHTGRAKLLLRDFDSLRRRGLTDQWTYNDNGSGNGYVRCGHNNVAGRLVTVARIIQLAEAGEIVRYRDGDSLNLRADNLTTRLGNAKRSATLRGEGAA